MILYNFFHDLIHVYRPRAGADSPQGTKFWCQQKCLVTSFICCKFQKNVTLVICCKFQKNLFEVWFYTIFFMNLYMYIAQGQGQTAPRGLNFDVNRNVLSLYSFVASFKKMSLKSDFIQFFHDFIHVYSPGAGADSPQGTKFWCQQKGLITLPICCKFQRNLFEVWFYTIFFMILYMYIAPGQGQTAPRGQSFDVNRNVLSLHSFVASFKKMSLKSDFIQFFHYLIHVYSPGAGADSP